MSLGASYYGDLITVFHPTGYDDWGTETGVTTEEVPARVKYSFKLIRTASGEQVVSRSQVETDQPVVVGDTITLPDDSTGKALAVQTVEGLAGATDQRTVYL